MSWDHRFSLARMQRLIAAPLAAIAPNLSVRYAVWYKNFWRKTTETEVQRRRAALVPWCDHGCHYWIGCYNLLSP